jgi:hypothetical protein
LEFDIHSQSTHFGCRITFKSFLIYKSLFSKAIKRSVVREISNGDSIIGKAKISCHFLCVSFYEYVTNSQEFFSI